MTWIDVDGGRLAVDVTGPDEGPLVVCLPGMGDLRSQYRLLAPRLVAAGWRVAAVDLRGHGDSDVFDEVGPERVGEDVVAVIDALGAETAVVLGSSAGAAGALWAAIVAPERVRALGLLGPVLRDADHLPSWLPRVLTWAFVSPLGGWLWRLYYRSLYLGGTPDDHDAHVAAVAAAHRERARRRATAAVGMSSKAGIWARRGEVACPSMVVMGSRDPDFPDADAEARVYADALGGRAHVLDGVGHYPHLERPVETAGLVVAFLEEVACRAA